MVNIEYIVRGKSPQNGILNYTIENSLLISKRPINLKLMVKMDPNHRESVDGEIILEMSNLSKSFYDFMNGQKEIVIPFDGAIDDFNEEIETSVILLTTDLNNALPLKVYLKVKAKNGNIYPEVAAKGQHIWDIGEVTMPMQLLMEKLAHINLNEFLK